MAVWSGMIVASTEVLPHPSSYCHVYVYDLLCTYGGLRISYTYSKVQYTNILCSEISVLYIRISEDQVRFHSGCLSAVTGPPEVWSV